jgi:hypothetical protein
MFAMKDYPRDILPLYAQGYSTARFLIAQGGRRKFIQFMETGFKNENWPAAVREHYGYGDLATLQTTWLDWVRQGSVEPVPASHAGSVQLASAQQPAKQKSGQSSVISGQSEKTAGGELFPDEEQQPLRPIGRGPARVTAAGQPSGRSWYARGEGADRATTTEEPRPVAEARDVARPAGDRAAAASDSRMDAL